MLFPRIGRNEHPATHLRWRMDLLLNTVYSQRDLASFASLGSTWHHQPLQRDDTKEVLVNDHLAVRAMPSSAGRWGAGLVMAGASPECK